MVGRENGLISRGDSANKYGMLVPFLVKSVTLSRD